jgi:hypothetical protein
MHLNTKSVCRIFEISLNYTLIFLLLIHVSATWAIIRQQLIVVRRPLHCTPIYFCAPRHIVVVCCCSVDGILDI